ncbi:MAG TPA: type IV pilus secretin PilQ [Acidobacteriota bacterium]|nr:type IV pilus secretin PilQ [Acidobacteriota bacterium]
MKNFKPHLLIILLTVAALSLAPAAITEASSGVSPEAAPALARMAAQQNGQPYQGAPITMKVVDIPLVDFFRIISEVSGLNVLIDPDVGGRVTLNMEAVPWDQLFDAVLRSNQLERSIEGNLVRISTKDTLQKEEEAKLAMRQANFLNAETHTDLFHLDYASAGDIATTLEEQLSDRGRVDVDPRTNTLIVTDVVGSFERIGDLLKRLDTPEMQVEIEARIVEATTNFARELGSAFNIEFGNAGTRNFGAGTSFAPQPNEDPIGAATFSTGTLLDTFRLDAFISAAETRGDARILSKPRVSAQNNAEAVITQGAKIPIPVTENFTTRVRFEEAALKLTVTPQITQEGTVLLNLRVENDVPDFSQTVLGIPTILTSQAETLVLVADGGTTVIGGIFTETDREDIRKVPGLGSVPVLGNLFKSSSVQRETREILFFITVRIK